VEKFILIHGGRSVYVCHFPGTAGEAPEKRSKVRELAIEVVEARIDRRLTCPCKGKEGYLLMRRCPTPGLFRRRKRKKKFISHSMNMRKSGEDSLGRA
jgi:hypothetical protein